ncbi:hypothetical protein BT96DRAFT_916766 [Gymnopus androsaceus JB14]|uniref:Prolyl 4-hydroxylase alpha subunit Fe(2+) 2OG dioxygenase domain-containing protein n=1 Tax=Gymnopus androsaceus JB14 TaxID=1447944 RepID=A0A6A4I2P6_9AGAR|nr:hypothetical protein BT96DRAFT_916766 [Gymnopus androsaceus JB14]
MPNNHYDEEEYDSDSDSESELSDGDDFREELSQVLDEFDFSDAPNPGLSLNGIGVVGLPASRAPFGHNEKTIVDKKVRDTWEIDPKNASFLNPAWNDWVKETALKRVSDGLGTEIKNVKIELYKLLLYERRLAHQDTVKAADMFATMIIILPSLYTGGQVQVSHAGKSQTFDFAKDSQLSTSVLAWYTDVFHEVKPVKSGYRLALSYNICQIAPTVSIPRLPVVDEAHKLLRRVLLKWREDMFSTAPSSVVAYLLDHQYSLADLNKGAECLKGQDKHRVFHLRAVAEEMGFVVAFATLVCRKNGAVDYETSDADAIYDEDDPYEEFGDGPGEVYMDESEEYDVSMHVENIVDISGKVIRRTKMELDEDCLIPENPFEDTDPDDKQYEGYMGNYGGNVDYYYRRTVMLLSDGAL